MKLTNTQIADSIDADSAMALIRRANKLPGESVVSYVRYRIDVYTDWELDDAEDIINPAVY